MANTNNIKTEISKDGKNLILTVAIDKSYGDSTSGKTLVVASSGGSFVVPGAKGPNGGALMVGVNVNEKKAKTA